MPSSRLRFYGQTPCVQHGDKIGVIAPSGPFDHSAFEAGLALLSNYFQVHTSDDIRSATGYLAGSDQRRLGELNRFLREPDLTAIIAARGGYGAMRLLPGLDLDALRTHPKLLVGFSDITALHAQWQRYDLVSLHAPMVAGIGKAERRLQARWLAALCGEFSSNPLQGLTPLVQGRASGRLVGGNLAVLCALLGTPFMPPLKGRVLLLEDIGEAPYRVDRLLTQLQLSGQLQQVAAVLVGAFTVSNPGPAGVTVEEVIAQRLAELSVPVLTGLPVGHISDNLEIPLGAQAHVDAYRGEVRFDAPGRLSGP